MRQAPHGRGKRHDTAQRERNTAPCAMIQCATWRIAHVLRQGAIVRAWALQHCRARPTTRCSACAVCAQAGPRMGALCTRLNFDSVHCSESLLGHRSRTLFMSTVHEVFNIYIK